MNSHADCLSREDVRSLIGMLEDRSPQVRLAVLDVLSYLELESEVWLKVRPYVIAVLRDPSAPEHREVIDTAARIPLRSVRWELGRLTESAADDDRRCAALALATAGDPRAVDPLIRLLDDPVWATAAARHLARLDASSRLDELLGRCGSLPEDPASSWVRFWLALALARCGRPGQLPDAVLRLHATDLWGEDQHGDGDRPGPWDPSSLVEELRCGAPLPASVLEQLESAHPGPLTDLLRRAATPAPPASPAPTEAPQVVALSAADRSAVIAAVDQSPTLRPAAADRAALPEALEQMIGDLDIGRPRAAKISVAASALLGRLTPTTEGVGNAVVEAIAALGNDYLPDLDSLLDAYLGLGGGPDGGLRAQIAWAASRRGLVFLVLGLTHRIPSAPQGVARLVAEAARYVRMSEALRSFAGPEDLPVAPPAPGVIEDVGPEESVGSEEIIDFGVTLTPDDFRQPRPAKPQPPTEPRRLVARVWDGQTVLRSVLPPKRPLRLGIRVAIPDRAGGDIAADQPLGDLPVAEGPMVDLVVAVRGTVWTQPPTPKKITVSRQNLTQPSTWADFAFTTPDDTEVVQIEIVLTYQGKQLQAATLVSAVRDDALPGEVPTLTVFESSAPREPTEDLRPVDVLLDGRGGDLVRWGSDQKVNIDVAQMLDIVERRVSTVLGVPNAPDSLNNEQVRELLVDLARKGVELGRLLEPLTIGEAPSIDIVVNPDTPVLPLELVYAGPAPVMTAKVCQHAAPPPAGRPCRKASRKTVCPFGFWGLYRTITRTVQWHPDQGESTQRCLTPLALSSVLYAATMIADEGCATPPAPSDRVFRTAQRLFGEVKRVSSWTRWVDAIKQVKPSLLVILGHTQVQGGSISLYIGKKSALDRFGITADQVRTATGPRPLILLIACASADLADPFGSLPGALTAHGAGAVVGTLACIDGPAGAVAASHLLEALRDEVAHATTVGDAVATARRSLIAAGQPIGLLLVTHGEMNVKVEV